MSSSLFTKLLIQRLKELTNPNRSREEIEDDYFVFETSLAKHKVQLIEKDELIRLKNELASLRQQIASMEERDFVERRDKEYRDIEHKDVESPPPSEIPYTLKIQLDRIENRLRELLRLQDMLTQVDDLEQRLSQAQTKQLIQPANIEDAIIREYFAMDESDFNDLVPEIHIWFLEKMLGNKSNTLVNNLMRLVDTYLQTPVGIVRYLILRVLIRFDHDRFHIRILYNNIIQQHDNLNYQSKLLGQLTNILIDLSTPASLQMLRFLVQNEQNHSENNQHIENAIRMRIRKIGEHGLYLYGLLN